MISPGIQQRVEYSGGTTTPIRVAHLLHTVAHGGVETALLNWFATFDHSIDARMYCFSNPGGTEEPFLEAASAQGLPVGILPWSRWKPVLRCALQMAEEVRRHNIDILHCHNTYANLVGILTAKLTPVRTATTYYVWGNFTVVRNALQGIDRLLMGQFDQVTAHCEQCLHDTVDRGYPEHRLRLAICGYPEKGDRMNPVERASMRDAMGIRDSDRVLIYGARFWPEKAHTNLLDAMVSIHRRHPEAVLLLPGAGPELEAAKAHCSKLHLDNCVRFLGFRDDYDRLLDIADIMVHPSDNEGVALAVCAAMSAGLPIVASRVGGLMEVLKHEESAILIPPRDPAALANSVSALINDPDRAKALGLTARRFIQEEYSLKVATSRLTGIYADMMRRPVSGRAT
ncbi:MAG TPA: glycosyltransferase family 4 protein [Bryobacteraceae bacterium]|nr:glycosyltransferase family 4 protein [Bryobacteraceae bacterium]